MDLDSFYKKVNAIISPRVLNDSFRNDAARILVSFRGHDEKIEEGIAAAAGSYLKRDKNGIPTDESILLFLSHLYGTIKTVSLPQSVQFAKKICRRAGRRFGSAHLLDTALQIYCKNAESSGYSEDQLCAKLGDISDRIEQYPNLQALINDVGKKNREVATVASPQGTPPMTAADRKTVLDLFREAYTDYLLKQDEYSRGRYDAMADVLYRCTGLTTGDRYDFEKRIEEDLKTRGRIE